MCKAVHVGLALVFAAWAGAVSAVGKETPASLLSSVDLSNGVDRKEAENIARAYFLKNVCCGAFTGISDGGNVWNVEGLHGYAAEPIKGFTIDKKTVAISSPVAARPKGETRRLERRRYVAS